MTDGNLWSSNVASGRCSLVVTRDGKVFLGEFDTLPDPKGEEWQRALAIAEAVYYQRYTPVLRGATHFHASYIKPDWAKEKNRVAKIGRHVFYK